MAGEVALRRFDRVWLARDWERALRAPLSLAERDVAVAWIAAGLPLVAARGDAACPGAVALGLSRPPDASPRRVALRVDGAAIARIAPPLALAEVLRSAPESWRAPLAALDAEARRADLVLRVHGSLAWQHLTGLPHLTPASDVDLLVRPPDGAALARALSLLARRATDAAPRLDGEVILPGGVGVAWRELACGADRVLGKTVTGVALLPRRALFAEWRPIPPSPAAQRGERGGLAAQSPLLAPAALGAHAVEALREELETWPKPGLVSPGEAGAHADMDAATFLASLEALRGWFPAVARAGAAGAPFPVLRALGVAAEEAMLAATGGVNTHRGAIFALGVLAAAAGRLAAEGMAPEPAALRGTVRRAYGRAIRRELRPAHGSHGAAVALRHGVGGARAEAAAGFPHLFDVALPAFHGALRRGAPRRAAAVEALLATMAVLPDTNLLWRGGPAGLAFARDAARAFLRGGGVHRAGWEEEVRGLHAAFVRRRLSPGGSADLLAGALYVDRLRSGRAA